MISSKYSKYHKDILELAKTRSFIKDICQDIIKKYPHDDINNQALYIHIARFLRKIKEKNNTYNNPILGEGVCRGEIENELNKQQQNELEKGNVEFDMVVNDNETKINGEYISSEKDTNSMLDNFLKDIGIDKKKFKIVNLKVGRSQVSSKYRDQDLKWQLGEHHDKEGNYIGQQQLMSGHAIRKNEWVRTYNYNIKVTLKPNENFVEEAIEDWSKDLKSIELLPKINYYDKGGNILLEIANVDTHIGKLATIKETGYRDYDVDKSLKDLNYCVNQQLSWATRLETISEIEFLIGNDLFHVDNLDNRTTHGTHTLDVDGRLPKIARKTIESIVNDILLCRQVAPVRIRWIPGNHDFIMSMMLVVALDAAFRNDLHVNVDLFKEKSGMMTRKARLWGNLLIGWTHRIVGKESTWANELAQAYPEKWGQSKLREWHCGDQHKGKLTKVTPEFTAGGVIIRQLTALSPVDKWHFENIFTDAVPGGDSFLWCKDRGVFAHHVAWIGQYENYRDKLMKKQN